MFVACAYLQISSLQKSFISGCPLCWLPYCEGSMGAAQHFHWIPTWRCKFWTNFILSPVYSSSGLNIPLVSILQLIIRIKLLLKCVQWLLVTSCIFDISWRAIKLPFVLQISPIVTVINMFHHFPFDWRSNLRLCMLAASWASFHIYQVSPHRHEPSHKVSRAGAKSCN